MNAPDATAWGLLRSSSAATLAQVWRMGLLLGTNLVLRRLLAPGEWGIWTWAESVFLILAAARDLGMPSHVVRLRPSPFGSLLAVEGVWGAAVAAGVAISAPLLARLAAEPMQPAVVPVLQALAVYLLLEGVAAVPLTFLEAELRVQRTLLPEFLRGATYCAVTIALALSGRGVWSIVWGQIAAVAIYAAALWLATWREMPLLAVPAGELPRLVRDALPVGSVWFLQLAVVYLDGLIVGWRFEPVAVGEYGFALLCALLATRVMQQPVARALYPAFVALRDDPQRKFEAYRLGTLVLAALEVPAAALLAVNADLAVRLLGGSQWVSAPGFLRILAFAPLVDLFGRFGGELLIALHRDRVRVVSLVASLVSIGIAGVLLTGWLGPSGMAWARYLPLGALVVAWAVHRVDPAGFRRLAADLGGIVLVTAPLFAAVWALGPAAPWPRLGLSLAAAAGSLGVSWWRFGADFRSFFGRRAGAQ